MKGLIVFVLIASLLHVALGGGKGTLKSEKDDCNPTGVGFSCDQQQKLLKGLKIDTKKIIIVPPKCPAGKRFDRHGKCRTIY